MKTKRRNIHSVSNSSSASRKIVTRNNTVYEELNSSKSNTNNSDPDPYSINKMDEEDKIQIEEIKVNHNKSVCGGVCSSTVRRKDAGTNTERLTIPPGPDHSVQLQDHKLVEPGTPVQLCGVVWLETSSSGLLVINVTWRGRSYVGSLMDASKHHLCPSMFLPDHNNNSNNITTASPPSCSGLANSCSSDQDPMMHQQQQEPTEAPAATYSHHNTRASMRRTRGKRRQSSQSCLGYAADMHPTRRRQSQRLLDPARSTATIVPPPAAYSPLSSDQRELSRSESDIAIETATTETAAPSLLFPCKVAGCSKKLPDKSSLACHIQLIHNTKPTSSPPTATNTDQTEAPLTKLRTINNYAKLRQQSSKIKHQSTTDHSVSSTHSSSVCTSTISTPIISLALTSSLSIPITTTTTLCNPSSTFKPMNSTATTPITTPSPTTTTDPSPSLTPSISLVTTPHVTQHRPSQSTDLLRTSAIVIKEESSVKPSCFIATTTTNPTTFNTPPSTTQSPGFTTSYMNRVISPYNLAPSLLIKSTAPTVKQEPKTPIKQEATSCVHLPITTTPPSLTRIVTAPIVTIPPSLPPPPISSLLPTSTNHNTTQPPPLTSTSSASSSPSPSLQLPPTTSHKKSTHLQQPHIPSNIQPTSISSSKKRPLAPLKVAITSQNTNQNHHSHQKNTSITSQHPLLSSNNTHATSFINPLYRNHPSSTSTHSLSSASTSNVTPILPATSSTSTPHQIPIAIKQRPSHNNIQSASSALSNNISSTTLSSPSTPSAASSSSLKPIQPKPNHHSSTSSIVTSNNLIQSPFQHNSLNHSHNTTSSALTSSSSLSSFNHHSNTNHHHPHNHHHHHHTSHHHNLQSHQRQILPNPHKLSSASSIPHHTSNHHHSTPNTTPHPSTTNPSNTQHTTLNTLSTNQSASTIKRKRKKLLSTVVTNEHHSSKKLKQLLVEPTQIPTTVVSTCIKPKLLSLTPLAVSTITTKVNIPNGISHSSSAITSASTISINAISPSCDSDHSPAPILESCYDKSSSSSSSLHKYSSSSTVMVLSPQMMNTQNGCNINTTAAAAAAAATVIMSQVSSSGPGHLSASGSAGPHSGGSLDDLHPPSLQPAILLGDEEDDDDGDSALFAHSGTNIESTKSRSLNGDVALSLPPTLLNGTEYISSRSPLYQYNNPPKP